MSVQTLLVNERKEKDSIHTRTGMVATVEISAADLTPQQKGALPTSPKIRCLPPHCRHVYVSSNTASSSALAPATTPVKQRRAKGLAINDCVEQKGSGQGNDGRNHTLHPCGKASLASRRDKRAENTAEGRTRTSPAKSTWPLAATPAMLI